MTIIRVEAMNTFALNGKTYGTDEDTLAVLRDIIPVAKETGDTSAVQAVMELGLATGRIRELAPCLPRQYRFDDAGRVTLASPQASDKPVRETQASLLDWAQDQQKLAAWKKAQNS